MKLTSLNMDIHPGERLFFFSTTGWMMWNFLASSLLAAPAPFSTTAIRPTRMSTCCGRWRRTPGANLFGASPTLRRHHEQGGHRARTKIRSVAAARDHAGGLAGHGGIHGLALSQRQARFLGLSRQRGTDCCTGFVGGVATLPVYAGEIQAPHLGVAAKAFDEQGRSVIDQVGELVITEPMPSMPIYFLERSRRPRYPEGLFRRLSGHLAARRFLPHQRPRRLLRARPLRRHAQSPRHPHRHGGNLSRARALSTRSTTR